MQWLSGLKHGCKTVFRLYRNLTVNFLTWATLKVDLAPTPTSVFKNLSSVVTMPNEASHYQSQWSPSHYEFLYLSRHKYHHTINYVAHMFPPLYIMHSGCYFGSIHNKELKRLGFNSVVPTPLCQMVPFNIVAAHHNQFAITVCGGDSSSFTSMRQSKV